MNGSRKLLRPQDILVVSKLSVLGSIPWTQMEIAKNLGLSQTEIAFSLDRLRFHHLLGSDKRKPLPGALLEFLVHGLKYVFPAEVGGLARGMPTAGAAKPLSKKLRVPNDQVLVWPDEGGTVRGQSLKPIYETVPKAVKNDSALYEFMALLDALRVGGVRQRELSTGFLTEKIISEKKGA